MPPAGAPLAAAKLRIDGFVGDVKGIDGLDLATSTDVVDREAGQGAGSGYAKVGL